MGLSEILLNFLLKSKVLSLITRLIKRYIRRFKRVLVELEAFDNTSIS